MKRRINKRMLYITLSVMIISVFTLTIAYAVLSTSLNITGSAEISGSSWDITIDKIDILGDLSKEEIEEIEQLLGHKYFDHGIIYGDAKLVKEPTISGTTISNAQILITKPNDGIVFAYEITNNGTIPAKIDSIVKNIPSFSSSSNNTSDIELISDNWVSDFSLSEVNGSEDVGVDYILCPGEAISLELVAGLDDTATAVPSSNITISNFGCSINFVQADKNTCSNS